MRWKILTIFCISFLLLITSCITEKTNSIYSYSDFEPNIGIGPNAKPLTEPGEDASALRILRATSTDGVNWKREAEPFIDRAGALDAVIDQEGRIFLYYMSGHDGLENIWVAAVSEDQGETWVHKKIDVAGQPENGKIADTSTILLEDGTLRSYFQSQFPGDEHNYIRSARSSDGLYWVMEEGLRLDELENGHFGIAPLVIQIAGQTHMYVHNAAATRTTQNTHLVSSNGLDFTEDGVIEIEGNFANGEWVNNKLHMYSFYVPRSSGPFQASLSYTTTDDGYTFTNPKHLLSVDSTNSNGLEYFMLKEPDVVQLADGTYMMFYLSGFGEEAMGQEDSQTD